MARGDDRHEPEEVVPSFGMSLDPEEIQGFEGEDIYAQRQEISEYELIDAPPPLHPRESGSHARKAKMVVAREDRMAQMPTFAPANEGAAPQSAPQSAPRSRSAWMPRLGMGRREKSAPEPTPQERDDRAEGSAFGAAGSVDPAAYGVDPAALSPSLEDYDGPAQRYPGEDEADPFDQETPGLAPDALPSEVDRVDADGPSAAPSPGPAWREEDEGESGVDAIFGDEDEEEDPFGSERPRQDLEDEEEDPFGSERPRQDLEDEEEEAFGSERPRQDLEDEEEETLGAERISLSGLQQQGKDRSKRKRRMMIGAGAVALALAGGTVVAMPELIGQSAPVTAVQGGADWFAQVPRVENPVEGFSALDAPQVWTVDTARSAVFSDGIMVLEGDNLTILSIQDGKTPMVKQRLRAAIDYTLQSRTAEDTGVISWVSGGTLNSWVAGTDAPTQWELPANAKVTSPGGGLMVTSDEGVFAAVPGKPKLMKVDVPDGWSAGAVDGTNVVLVNRSAPEVMVVDAKDQQGRKVSLAQPFENARVAATVHAGDGIAAVLWSSPAMSDVLTLSIHSLEDGEVLSSVPVLARQASSATLAWNTGQGGKVAYYGPYTFDMSTHQPVSRFSDQEVIAGAAGEITWITSNNQNIYQSGGQSWVDSRTIAGMSRDGLIVIRQPDGSLSAVQGR